MSGWTQDFEEASAVIYVANADLRLTQANRAWNDFALRNGGGQRLLREQCVGCNILDSIPDVLKPFYTDAFTRVANGGGEWNHIYECSSPTELRRMHMRVLPFASGGLLFVHSFVSSQPAPPASSLNAGGEIVRICAHCRRTHAGEDQWVWVPELVAAPHPRISHGLCDVCFAYHYPDRAARRQAASRGLTQE